MAEAANSDGLLIDLKLMRFRVTDELAEGTVDSDGAIILSRGEHNALLERARSEGMSIEKYLGTLVEKANF
jgi:hypothetical protein